MREYVFVRLDSEYSLNENLESHFFEVKSQEKIALLINLL